MSLVDDDLNRARTELGEPEALFHISAGWLRAKLGIAVALVLYGVAANYFWWVHGPQNFHHAVIHFLIWPPAIGAVLLFHMYRNRGLFVLVYPTGLLRLRRGEVDSLPWSEIKEIKLKLKRTDDAIRLRSLDGSLIVTYLPVYAPTVQVWNAGLTVVRSDGQEAHFGPALADYPKLAEDVQRRTFALLWPTVWGRFCAGETIAFGDLEVSPTGLHHGKKLLRWRDFNGLFIAQGRLTVKKDGKWLPWVLLDVSGIPNPHILFALVAEAHLNRVPLKRQPHKDE